MDEIAEDIRETVELALLNHDRDVSSTIRSMLAAVIMAERERCAKIAASDVPEDCGLGPGGLIAQAIRGEREPRIIPWNRIIDGKEPNGLVLAVTALFETGEQLGYDLVYFEDGDWMYSSHDGDPNPSIYVTHWCALPDLPEA